MIDEVALFDALISEHKSSVKNKVIYGFSFKYDKKTNKEIYTIEGFPRFIITVARGFLFDEEIKEWQLDKKIDYCIYFLRLWMGCIEIDKNNYPDLPEKFYEAENWLGKYIDFYVEEKKKKEKPKKHQELTIKFAKLKNIYQNKNKSLSQTLFQTSGLDGNDQNRICWASIIADALNEGKLNRYALILKKSSPNYGITTQSINEKRSSEFICIALGIVCYALMSDKRSQSFELSKKNYSVRDVELSNFLKIRNDTGGDVNKASVADCLNKDVFFYDDQRLFKKVDITGAKKSACRKKLYIDESWLNDYNVELVRYDEPKDLIPYLKNHNVFINNVEKGISKLSK